MNKSQIALIHSNGSLGTFTPSEEFDRDFQALGAAVTKIPVKDLAEDALQGKDLVIVSSMLLRDASDTPYWSNRDKLLLDTYGPSFKKYLTDGGVLLLTDIIESDGSYSLSNIASELKLKVEKCETGLIGTFGKSRIVTAPHRLTSYETNYDPFQICRRVGGKFAWGRFADARSWDVLIRNPAGQPVMLSRQVGKGTLVASTLSAGRGIDAGLLENLLFYKHATSGQPLASSEFQVKPEYFRVKARAPRGKVPFDKQGNILVEGRPFFPFGFYKVDEKSYPILKKHGFNSIQGINPEEAVKHGLYGTISSSWDLKQAREWTTQNKDNPSVIAQQLVEEPGNLPVPPFYSNYMHEQDDAVKEIAPNRPTFVLVNNPLEFPAFGNIGDLGVCDPYPFEKADSSAVRPGRDIDYLRQLSGNPNYPVWAVLQAHWFGEKNAEPYLVKPTPDQLLAQTYVSLVHRANGIFYFAFDQGDMPDDANISFIHRSNGTFDEPLWSTLKQLAKEIKVLEPALLAPLPRRDARIFSKDKTIQFLLRKSGDRFYLMAVNPEARAVDATVELGEESDVTSLKTLFGGQQVRTSDSRFRFTFAPYQRVVFEYGVADKR